MLIKTLALLENLLAGEEWTQVVIDNLLSSKTKEDQYLEYKHADILKDKNKANFIVRQYVSGFANSGGGILVIGVDEKTWRVTPCLTPGGGDLAEWAATVLNPIAHLLSPLPLIGVVKHQDGNILLIAVARSMNMIPLTQHGKVVYYLRIHDETIEAPEYLISDILLGRRNFPNLEITDLRFLDLSQSHNRDGEGELNFRPIIRVENVGLFWSENTMVGIISRVKNPIAGSLPIGKQLMSYIDLNPAKDYIGSPIYAHCITLNMNPEPFRTMLWNNIPVHTVPVRGVDRWYTPFEWKAAIYILPHNTPPVWYQATLSVNNVLLDNVSSGGDISHHPELINISRMYGDKPIVAWEFLNAR